MKSPLWIIVIGFAFFFTLYLSRPLTGISAFGLIFVYDLIIILSAMVPQATVDDCKKYCEWMALLDVCGVVSFGFYTIYGFALILAAMKCLYDSIYSNDSVEEMNKIDNVVKMHALFAGLFMSSVYIKQLFLPIIIYPFKSGAK